MARAVVVAAALLCGAVPGAAFLQAPLPGGGALRRGVSDASRLALRPSLGAVPSVGAISSVPSVGAISPVARVGATSWRLAPLRSSRLFADTEAGEESATGGDEDVTAVTGGDEDDVTSKSVEEKEEEEEEIPFRSETAAGYASKKKEWGDFQYQPTAVRREVARKHRGEMCARSDAERGEWGFWADVRSLPPIHVVLVGGPCSGKGTIAPMLSQAFRCRVVGVGTLLRGEIRAQTPRGEAAAETMQKGDLLPDDLVLGMVNERICGSHDAQQNGWLLDGFPRTAQQATALVSGKYGCSLQPDCVVVLQRPDELIREFALGRMVDTATGHTYHPVFAPPPADIQARLVWRVDDTPAVINKRIADYQSAIGGILEAFEENDIPTRQFNNAQSELETFAQVAEFVESVARAKLEKMGGPSALMEGAERRVMSSSESSAEEADVAALCSELEGEEECLIRYEEEIDETVPPLLTAVRRCNEYDPNDFIPVLVGDEQVGWTPLDMLDALSDTLAKGEACELAMLKSDNKPRDVAYDAPPQVDIPGYSVAVRLAPQATGGVERSDTVAAIVDSLVEDGYIPKKALRRERQEVRPLAFGFGGPGAPPPLLQMERAAMIHFGMPAFAIHVNGFVRGPEGEIASVWVGTRSMSKATYPGLLDQVVAGGQPAGLSFLENVEKECLEEASLPPEVIAQIQPAGVVSYRYTTRKGLSTKSIAVFDLEFPEGMSPICGDGEVEEFNLMTIEHALESIRTKLPLWKPNAALVMVDFALRHGFISSEEPGYEELQTLLRRS